MAKQTFTAGQVLTAAEMNSLQENDYNWTVTTKTASYTLAAGDEGTRIVMNNAGATTITVDDAIFSAGDVVWIHNIGAGTCTITAGTATVSTLGELALEQYAGGHLYFTSAAAAIFFPTEQGGGGKILQVVSTTKTDTFSASIGSGADTAITGLSATITPSSATSNILVLLQVNGSEATNNYMHFGVRLYRDATEIGSGAAASSRTTVIGAVRGPNTAEAATIGNVGASYLDSPATTSATTYAVHLTSLSSGTTTYVVNRSGNDSTTAPYARSSSHITLMEVSA